MVRNLVIAAIVFAVAFGLVRGRIAKNEEEKLRREDVEYRKSVEVANERNENVRQQMDQRMTAAHNCATAMTNRRVLQDASASGGRIIASHDFKPLDETDVRLAQRDNERYIEENCKKP